MNGPATTGGGGAVHLVELDVRSVEPKHRFERIMGAYESLGTDQTLELTVDHDPKCMYYTLKATRGDEAFRFEYVESGPMTWRVHVRKRDGAGAVGGQASHPDMPRDEASHPDTPRDEVDHPGPGRDELDHPGPAGGEAE